MTRFLIVNTDYAGFLDSLYAAHPGLEEAPYERQLAVRNESLFGVSDFYPRNLNRLGHAAVEFHINNWPLQRAWAREHGVSIAETARSRLVLRRGVVPWLVRDISAWMAPILRTQIEDFRPDVILTHSLSDLPQNFWKKMRPHYRLLIGQIASPLASDIDLRPFDLMLSSLPSFVERFRRSGLRAELFRLAFDPAVLDSLAEQEKPIDVSFVGSLSPHHRGRFEWLEALCRRTSIDVWGQGVEELPEDSAIRKSYRGPAWGREMFRILRRSRISLNFHIELSGPDANNMRLYETTGVGSLLLTDWKANLADMFVPEVEVAAYRTVDECVQRIERYLADENKRATISRAGQERTLRDHTYSQRMAQLVNLAENLL